MSPQPNYLEVAASLVHEGQHALDAVLYHQPSGPSGAATASGLATLVSEDRQTEQDAYGTEAIFDQAEVLPEPYLLVTGRPVNLTPATADQVAEGSVKIVQNQLSVQYPKLIAPYSIPSWMK